VTARPLLIVVPTLHWGGAERHSAWMATEADRRSWNPHVLAFADGPLRAELTAAGVTVEVPALPERGRPLAAAAAVWRTVDRLRPALITGQHILVEVAIRLALRHLPAGARPPYLAWKHTYGHIGYRGPRERLFERATGAAVTRYGAVCHTQVRYLTDGLGVAPHKISVLPNAVPVPARCPDPAGPGVPTVLMTAAMRADKDHGLVLRAWPGVLSRQPEARLRLAGDGPVRSELEKLAAELGIGSSVEFLGVRADVGRLLADAHLLVLASYAVECFPYAVLEAMAAGRGVVATNVAGLPELVDDRVTGRLVPPRDAAALSDALIEGLADGTSACARWGLAGWRRAGTVFPLSQWAVRLDELLGDVAGATTR
jgi:glycosyltransferase involved in cell wall biosynthesis